jgi:Cu2+-exporting ATPase
VSCPCALSLATPTVLAAATERLLRQGVLVVQPHVLETLQRATHIVFDKTGTLTEGKPTLHHIHLCGPGPEAWCLHAAAALEASSAHPLAAAIAAAASGDRQFELHAEALQTFAGRGLEGSIDGRLYRLGSMEFVAGISGPQTPEPPPSWATPVYLGMQGCWLARFDLADELRPDAKAVIDSLRMDGKQILLLSGDDDSLTRRVAAGLGIEQVQGGCSPDRKLERVQALQRQGAVVAMVGDGINDAAVLRAADVSFAMGAGAALAQASADAVLVNSRLSSVRETIATAERAVVIMRQNLAWSLLYNALAIPAAAIGLLNPWLSGVGMAVSSALVVGNALRIYADRAPARQPAPAAPRPATASGAV